MEVSYGDTVKLETMVSSFPKRDVYTFQRVRVKTFSPRIKALRLFCPRFCTYSTSQHMLENIWISSLHPRVKNLRHLEGTRLFAG